MLPEQNLMRNLMRACASARRHPQRTAGPHPHRGRGFGHILDLLAEGEGVSQQQIADALSIRPQSVSEAISTLEERGLIRKEPSPRDKRSTLIYITEQGIARRAELAEERKAHAIRFFSVLSDEEKETLLRLLEKLNESVDRRKEEW